MKLTRRELAGTLVSATVAAAQTTETPTAPSQEQLSAAHERVRASVKALEAAEVPMATEPAFRFTA